MDAVQAKARGDIDREVADLARGQHGLVTRAQLDELQVTRRQRQWRLQRGRWEAPFEGIFRLNGLPGSWRSDLLAMCLAGNGYASHRSAAALWDLPGARRDRPEIITERWQRAQHTGLVVHESIVLTDDDQSEIDGIPCTTIERTIFDLCAAVSPMTVDLALDRALRRRLTTPAQLAVTERRLATRGRRGSKVFHGLLASRTDSIPIPESPPERLLARALVRQGLPAPLPQFIVRDRDGREVARCDLAYPQWRIVIEYDSVQEHVGRAALIRDSARRNAIAALGFVPVTATVVDLKDGAQRLASVIRRIRDVAA